MPAVLYRYIQVLRRPDLVNSKGKPLVTNARLEAVWKRLSERLATVVADTSMITLSTAYATHFHDIYIDGKENAKMTGDRMKMLMLTLPFMVRDLIAPEVHLALYILGILSITMYILGITAYMLTCTHIYQVKLINTAIDNAKGTSRLQGLQHVADPSAVFLSSYVYEVNPWLWSFGRGKPRLGGLSIEQTGEEGRHEQCTAQAGSRDKTGSQDGLSLIPSKGWYISVCTELYVVYTGIYTNVPSLHT